MSPIPALQTVGSPAANYSGIIVGEAAICEKVALRYESPSRARLR